jgi:isocitrate lyase
MAPRRNEHDDVRVRGGDGNPYAAVPGVRDGLLRELCARDRNVDVLPLVRDDAAGGGVKEERVESKGAAFRRLLREEEYVFTGGVYSPLDAQIAEQVGVKAIYMSGYSVALANGYPDMGLLTMTEVTKVAAMMAGAVKVPIIADADDGYGNALSTRRTVQEFVRAGVAGIHLEDQRFPKRCGHIAGKTLVSREEAVGKFRAAADVRAELDPEFVLIARTDAYGAVGGSLEEAIWRGRAYADAGADLVWSEFSGPAREPAVEFAKAMRASHPGLPLAFNYSSSFRWHQDSNPLLFRELGDLGYKFIFITLYALHAGSYAVWTALEDLVKNQEQAQWTLERQKVGHPTESHHVMARVADYQELERRYIPGTEERIKASDGFDDGRAH